MAFIGENQVRNIFIVNTSTNTTMSAVKAGVNLNGAVIQSDGTAAAANEEFAVVVKNNKKGITLSDIVNPKRVTYAKVLKFEARTLKSDVITNIVAEANKLYVIRVTIAGYGSLSVEDEYVKQAAYKSKTGDTVEDIIDGLVKSLARNFSRDGISTGEFFTYTAKGSVTLNLPGNSVFEFTKTGTGTLTIKEKADYLDTYYVTGKKDKLYLDYSVSVDFPTAPTVTSTQGSIGVGSGYQVRNMEYCLLGNRQDTMRGMGYPHNFDVEYDSVLSAKYNLIELGYWDEGRDDPMKSKKQITIAVPFTNAASNATTNKLVAQINTALDGSIVMDTLAVV